MSQRLTREEFHRWADGQTQRYERVAGQPVRMSLERVIHARLKTCLWQTLDRAIREAGLDCEAPGDGIPPEVDDETEYEPDAIVNCGARLDPDAIAEVYAATG